MEKGMQLPHDMTLKERKYLSLTGVTEVVSVDDSAVVLRTQLGDLTVHGQGLRLKNLTLEGGRVAVEGAVAAIVYEEPRQGGWLRRLLG